jgi:hypothetical protein
MQRPIQRPIYRAINQGLLTRPGGESYAAIITDAGELASFVTFARSSTGSRYNSAGLLESVAANAPRYDYDPTTVTRANLFTQSEFQNGVTDAPVRGGLLTATPFDGLYANSGLQFGHDGVTGAYAYKAGAPVSTTCTISVFVQMDDGNPPIFGSGSGSDGTNTFYLVIAAGATNPTTYNVQNFGGGLYRVSATAVSGTNAPNSGVVKYPSNDNRTFKVSGYQLEVGSIATDYIPTTASPAGNATLRGLLIEEQRTNVLLHSADLTQAAWTKSALTLTSNAAVAPDGTLTADLVVDDATAAQHFFAQNFDVTNGIAYTVSFYVKAAGKTQCVYTWSTASSSFASSVVTFNLSAVTASVVGAGSATIAAVGNGWYRCTTTNTATATVISSQVYFSLTGLGSYTGDGTTGVYYWGMQTETGAFATSYIPTTTASVTRAVDSAIVTGANFSSLWNASNGTLFAEATPSSAPASDGVVRFVAAAYDNVGYTNAIRIERLSGAWRLVKTVSGASVVASGTWNSDQAGKLAFAYFSSDSAAVFNAGAPSAVSGSLPTGLTELGIGGNSGGGNNWCGHIRRLRYYPRRLPNMRLQGLTA